MKTLHFNEIIHISYNRFASLFKHKNPHFQIKKNSINTLRNVESATKPFHNF